MAFKLAEMFVDVTTRLESLGQGLNEAQRQIAAASESMGATAGIQIGHSATAGLATSLAGISAVFGKSFATALAPLQDQMANTAQIIRSAAIHGNTSLKGLGTQLEKINKHMDQVAGNHFDKVLGQKLKVATNPIWKKWLQGVSVLRNIQNQSEFTRASLTRAADAVGSFNPFKRRSNKGGGFALPSVMAPQSAKFQSGEESGGSSAMPAAAGLAMSNPGMALAAITAATGAASYKLAKMASDQTEAVNLLGVTFGKSSDSVAKSIDEIVAKFGESRTEMINLTSSIGGLFQGVGMGEQQIAGLSTELAKLAIDFGSLKNLGTGDVLEKIMSGLAGESEPLRRVGITFDEDMVKAKALAMGLGQVNGELSQQDKMAARAELIMRGLSVAAGDAAKTHGEFAGQSRELWGRLANLGTSVGKIFTPMYESILGTINSVLAKAAEAVDWLREKISTGVEAIKNLWANLGIYTQKMGVVFGGVLDGMGTMLWWLADSAMTFGNWFKSNWWKIMQDLSNATATAATNLISNIGKFLGWFSKNWRSIFQDAFDAVTTALSNLGKNFRDFGKAAYDWIKSGFTKPFDFKFTPVMEGFSAKTEAMPQFTPLLNGFTALTEALQLPGVPLERLQSIADEVRKRLAELDAGLKKNATPQEKQQADNARKNLAALDASSKKSKEAKADFFGVEDFAKNIQKQALGDDNVQKAMLKESQEQTAMWKTYINKQGQIRGYFAVAK